MLLLPVRVWLPPASHKINPLQSRGPSGHPCFSLPPKREGTRNDGRTLEGDPVNRILVGCTLRDPHDVDAAILRIRSRLRATATSSGSRRVDAFFAKIFYGVPGTLLCNLPWFVLTW